MSRRLRSRGAIPFRVYSYSGESMLPEQVASIRSFLQNAGRPKSFNVVSDGTHTERSIELLQRIDSCIAVTSLPGSARVPRAGEGVSPSRTSAEAPWAESLNSYLTTHPTGKQLALIMSLPVDEGPVLYVDSDVLFFKRAHELASLSETRGVRAFYLADCQFSGDERLLREASEWEEPVNTGVLLLFQKLDWSLSLQRFAELKGEPSFFTNQTMTHLAMHANGAVPFDREKYNLRLDDQFVYSDRYAGNDLALRHYVNSVRHKFWTTLRRSR
ncbi:MAG: hypothetical protein ABJB22_03870 [Verrucomicrobiota bacterium]